MGVVRNRAYPMQNGTEFACVYAYEHVCLHADEEDEHDLGSGDTAMNKVDKFPDLRKLIIL